MATDSLAFGDITNEQRLRWRKLAHAYDRVVADDRAEWDALAFQMFATTYGVLYPMTPGQRRVVDEEFARRRNGAPASTGPQASGGDSACTESSRPW